MPFSNEEWVRSLLDSLQYLLAKNPTIKERQQLISKLGDIVTSNLKIKDFSGIGDDELLSVWKNLQALYENMVKKVVTDLIKYKSEYLSKNPDFDYKNENIKLEKTIFTRFNDLLNYVSSLSKFFKIISFRLAPMSQYDIKGLLNWVIDSLIGADYIVFKDYQENFFDLTGGFTDHFKFHLQILLSEILLFTEPNRDEYDKILESQYLILVCAEKNKRYAFCYQNSFKILYHVFSKRYLGKVHGTWEKVLVSCFLTFLNNYSPKKEDEYLYRTGFEILRLSFIFNKNYKEVCHSIVDLIIKTPPYIDVVKVLEEYLLFLPAYVEYEIQNDKDNYWLLDIYRLIKHMFTLIVNRKIQVEYNFEVLESPGDSSWVKLGEYQYMISDRRMQVLAKYISLYYSLKPTRNEGLFSIGYERSNIKDTRESSFANENTRVRSDFTNYANQALQSANSAIEFINLLVKAFNEYANSEEILLPLSFLYFTFSLPVPETELLILLKDNSRINFDKKVLFFLALLKNQPSIALGNLSGVFFSLSLEALENIRNKNYGCISSYFFYTWVYTTKDTVPDFNISALNQKVLTILQNLDTLAPIGNTLSTFKFWQAVCCVKPIFNVDSHLTTFDFIIEKWLPKLNTNGFYISLTNFIHWGFSENKNSLINCKVCLETNMNVADSDLAFQLPLNRIQQFSFKKFEDLNKNWNSGCFRNLVSMKNVIFWLNSNISTFINKLGLLRLVMFICDEVNLETLDNLGFDLVGASLTKNFEDELSCDYVSNLVSSYDLFSVSDKLKNYPSILHYFNEKFRLLNYIVTFDCEMGKTEFHFVNDIFKFRETFSHASEENFLKAMILNDFENTQFNNYDYFSIKVDTFLNETELQPFSTRSTLINDIVNRIKDEINFEKIHTVDKININCILLGKIISSSVLMESQSKNKMIKLWLSLFSMIPPTTQPYSIASIKLFLKRLDVESQLVIFNRILNSVIFEQTQGCKFDLLFDLAKISKHFLIRVLKHLLENLSENMLHHLVFLLKKLSLHYKKSSVQELINFVGISFMSCLVKAYFNNSTGRIFISAIYKHFEYTKDNYMLILNDYLNRGNFIASVLAFTDDENVFKKLNIPDVSFYELTKARLLIQGNFDLPFTCVPDILHKNYEKLGDEATSYMCLSMELNTLDVGDLSSIVNYLCKESNDSEAKRVQSIMFEYQQVSLYEGGGILINQMELVNHLKRRSYSSVVIEGNVLRLFCHLDNQTLDSDSFLVIMRKIKIVYLLFEKAFTGTAFVKKLGNKIIKWFLNMPNFTVYLKRFRNFFFAVLESLDTVEDYIKTEILVNLLLSNEHLEEAELITLTRIISNDGLMLAVNKAGLKLLGCQELSSYKTSEKNIDYSKAAPELILRHFTSTAKLCSIVLSKEGEYREFVDIWPLKFSKRYVTMLNWNDLDQRIKAYLLMNLDNIIDDSVITIGCTPVETLTMTLTGKMITAHSAVDEFKLNLILCYFKTLLKDPYTNLINPPNSYYYDEMNIFLKGGLSKADLLTLLEYHNSNMWEQSLFFVGDSYASTIYTVWSNLISNFTKESIWSIILIVDIHFKTYNLLENAILYCFEEALRVKPVLLKGWEIWISSILAAVEHTDVDSKLKKSLVLKLFLKLRDLHYSNEESPSADLLYQYFDLKTLSIFASNLDFNELAFMLLEEERLTWDEILLWKPVFSALDDEFLASSLPRSLNLAEYIKESDYYIKDDRFAESGRYFNSSAIDLGFVYEDALLNLSKGFWETGNYKVAKSLRVDECQNDFSKYYDEIKSWNIPLFEITETASIDSNKIFYNFYKNELIFGKDKNEKRLLKKSSLLGDFLSSQKCVIEEKISGIYDEQLALLSDLSINRLTELSTVLDYSMKLNKSLQNNVATNKYTPISDCLSLLLEIKGKYGLNIAQNVLSAAISFETQKLDMQMDDEKYLLNTQQNLKSFNKTMKVDNDSICSLQLLNFEFNHGLENKINGIKALIKLFQKVNFFKTVSNFDYKNWDFMLKFMDTQCRWLTGDIQSSWNLLNALLEQIAKDSVSFPLEYSLKLILKKCIWSLESKKGSTIDIWCYFYEHMKKAINEPFETIVFKHDIEKLFSYYHNFISKCFLEKSPLNELDNLQATYKEFHNKYKILKHKIQGESQRSANVNKLKRNLKILHDNLVFVNERYSEVLKKINDNKRNTLNICCELLDVLSIDISKDVSLLNDEKIDTFFSLWFGLIDYLSKDLFDGEAFIHNFVQELQHSKRYYFTKSYKYETFKEKYSRTNQATDRDNLDRCFIVSWERHMKKWKESIDLILDKNPSSLLPWLRTFFSKLRSGRNNIFERLLENSLTDIILKCTELYPHFTILIALSYRKYSNDNNQLAKERSELIAILLNQSRAHNNRIDQMINSFHLFSDFNELLANCRLSSSTSNISLKSDNTCKTIFHKSSTEILSIFNVKNEILLPVVNFIDQNLYVNETRLEQFFVSDIETNIEISSTGISRPRISSFLLQNGLTYKVLIKGSDDLRTDFIMLNAMKKINKSIFKNTKYNIGTYEVSPMGYNFGMVEFKKGCMSLASILKPLHEKDELSFNVCRKQMDNAVKAKKSKQQRIEVFENIQAKVKPRFSDFFKSNFPVAEAWYASKKRYVASLAISSVIGYILGIGDRHMSNIMVNCDTGELVHIDFGITFEAGKKLSIPELVPFRFTRDIADGLGIYYHHHAVDRFFEEVYTKTRKDKNKIMLSLENLKLDPLYKWSLNADEKYFRDDEDDDEEEEDDDENTDSKHVYNFDDLGHQGVDVFNEVLASKRQKLSENNSYSSLEVELVEKNVKITETIAEQHSSKCLEMVLSKLEGGHERQSAESVVQMLLREAQSPQNLALIFYGWAPFY